MNSKQISIATIALLMLILSACNSMVMPVEAAEAPKTLSDKSVTVNEAYAHIGVRHEGESDQVNAAKHKKQVLEFEVSEDMTRFIFDQDVTYDDGLPADGSAFITRGYLYEPGTLNGSNGVNVDGSPEFPDKVIGEWICQGYMINDAGHATGGVWVFSTQFFQFGEEPGAETFVTTGYELADLNVPIARAITGGTGEFSTARGETNQTLLGLNATDGVNLRIEVEVKE